MIEKEKCSICRVDPVCLEVEVLPVYTAKSSLLEIFSEKVPEDPWKSLRICSVCSLFLFSDFPGRARLSRSIRPERVLRPLQERQSMGLCQSLSTEVERVLHGVSWLEANGLDQWLFPEVIKRTRDTVLWHGWFRYSLFDWLVLDYSDAESAYQLLTSRLKEVFRSRDRRLKPLFKKLRYIFREYSDAYTYGNPPSLSEKDWQRIVEQIQMMFESDPFDPKWLPVLDQFCDYLSAFWW